MTKPYGENGGERVRRRGSWRRRSRRRREVRVDEGQVRRRGDKGRRKRRSRRRRM